MKKINFKKPKYIIPLIMLPFFVLFFFIFNSWGNSQPPESVQSDSIPKNEINPTMPGVSSEVSDAGIKDKFDAYLEAYRHDKDASALDNIENRDMRLGSDYNSAYTTEDLQRLKAQQKLDSIQRSLSAGQADIDRRMASIHSTPNRQRPSTSRSSAVTEEELLKGFTYNLDERNNHKQKDPYNEQMRLFRDQMGIMDSMQKTYLDQATGTENNTNTSSVTETGRKRKTLTNNFNPKDFDPNTDSTFRPLPVSRNRGTRTGFNTISASKPENTIKAILDENIKATAGSKVRIRLLNDIFVGEYLIPQGTYLYGVVSGFQTQRINISINQVMHENKPLPIQMDVFDNDGYLGLYVPNSNFREFTKELGTQGTQGLSQVRTSDNSNVTSGLISQIFQTASTSVSKLIRQEKAFLKYNYIIYLKERNN
ncbi:MAG: conjugative transposon protein TraM [Sphingobacteriales bacterium 41-5]|nr:MAG: conjugative transposon protein TraM [Sphingobacteriales bacterium 41-5]